MVRLDPTSGRGGGERDPLADASGAERSAERVIPTRATRPQQNGPSSPTTAATISSGATPGTSSPRRLIVRRRSAIYWADRLDVPLLLMHGGADSNVDPAQSRLLDRLLTQAGKPHELVIFDGDNHVLREHREERDRRAVAWFRRYLE